MPSKLKMKHRRHGKISNRKRRQFLTTPAVSRCKQLLFESLEPRILLDGSPYSTAILTGGPVAYYRLGEASGANATDFSGNVNDGVYANGVSLGHAGAPIEDPDTAARFDGLDDHVSLPSTVLNGLSDITVEFWMQTTSGRNQAILSGANAGNDNEILVFLTGSTGLRLHTGESSNSYIDWQIPAVNDGLWHHLAVVRDATNDEASLYFDGVSQGVVPTTLSPLTIDTGGLFVGQDQDSVGGSFDATQALEGTLDELAIFGTALSASDVLAHYHARYAADERPPTLMGGSPLPEDGGSLTALLERFTIEASRDLVAAGVNDANSWELRGAGSDGAFATGDDVIYGLQVSPAYATGTTIPFVISDGPLPLGSYRFKATSAALVDPAGRSVGWRWQCSGWR